MKNIKNKKALLALMMVAVIGIVGVTIAYFTSSDTFTNVFGTKPYSMEVQETFESPTDWTPGTTTSKSIIATNKGDVEAAVRISYTESWVDAQGATLPLKDGSNNSAAVINFASDLSTKWTESTEGGTKYYYYKTKLAKNASTSSLINSVTFNPNVAIGTSNNCVDDTTNHTRTCTTSTSGYAGGTYTLTVTVETVQYDQYQTAWGTSVVIS
jgi:alternate signal-mediated exported protein